MTTQEVDLPTEIEVQILQNQCEGQEKEVGACERDSACEVKGLKGLLIEPPQGTLHHRPDIVSLSS